MKLNAVAVSSSNISKTVKFYKILGFEFEKFKDTDPHVETIPKNGSSKLMIDTKELLKDILGHETKPSNHSTFAVEYGSSEEVNDVVKQIEKAGFKVFKEPWDAFWGQRYAIVEDPDGYKVDLYSRL